MRLFFSISAAALLLSGLASAQVPGRTYGYGPYVPMVTTPQVSFQTVSPAPVGARNATYGLTAGARNSTFETMNDGSSSTYTEPLWYAGGGAPRVSNEVSLYPRPAHEAREMRVMEERHEAREAAPRQWTYIGASETEVPVNTSAGKFARRASRTITNEDIERANQNTGVVKYDGKTQKLQ